jgi:iron(III) transport system substrate-binding protein
MKSRRLIVSVSLVLLILALGACQAISPTAPAAPAAEGETATAAPAAAGSLVVYSGRSENLVAPVIEQFEAATGIDVEVRYGSTSEMAATILEEGANSPADVFFAQDAGALGALALEGRLAQLPAAILDQVDPRFESREGTWVGVTGRARTLVYNTDNVSPEELPAGVQDLTDPVWQGRVGWAPTNGSFQAFVTALRLLEGEEAARAWLEAMIANDVQVYENNAAIVTAVGAGEIDLGLVNHYYIYQFLKEQGEGFPARNHYLPTPGAGSIINIAGAGIIAGSENVAAAEQFINYLLSDEGQQYFATQTVEYPLAGNVEIDPTLKPLDEIAAPDLDLSNLEDLQGTLTLLQETGAIQ